MTNLIDSIKFDSKYNCFNIDFNILTQLKEIHKDKKTYLSYLPIELINHILDIMHIIPYTFTSKNDKKQQKLENRTLTQQRYKQFRLITFEYNNTYLYVLSNFRDKLISKNFKLRDESNREISNLEHFKYYLHNTVSKFEFQENYTLVVVSNNIKMIYYYNNINGQSRKSTRI